MVGVVAVLAVLTVLVGVLLQLPFNLANVADGERMGQLVSLFWR